MALYKFCTVLYCLSHVNVEDADSGDNGRFRCRLAGPRATQLYILRSRTSAGFWLGGQCPIATCGEENFENLTTKRCILKYI